MNVRTKIQLVLILSMALAVGVAVTHPDGRGTLLGWKHAGHRTGNTDGGLSSDGYARINFTTGEHRGKEGAATGGDADAGAAAASVASAAAGDGDAAYRRGLLHGLAVGAAAAAVIGVFCLRS